VSGSRPPGDREAAEGTGRRGSVAVVLASAGRPGLLADALADLERQASKPDRIIVSVPDSESLPGLEPFPHVDVRTGTRGLTAQRNVGLDLALAGHDYVAFFDDDAVLDPRYLAKAVSFMDSHPECAGMTGRVVADGSRRDDELSRTEAEARLRAAEEQTGFRTTRHLFGCNFVVRSSAVTDLRFDEDLPLYGWLEDRDFAGRLRPRGSLYHYDGSMVAHRGASSGGRRSHLRLGYSQIANAVHLRKRRSFSALEAATHIVKPVSKNLIFSIAGGAATWRRQRLHGNALAIADAMRGRLHPRNILDL
jgi:GT2 family glycosyltransferase